MELPKRKPNRLKQYDYSQKGGYFITICVKDRKPILSNVAVGASSARPFPELTAIGKIVDDTLQSIPDCYPGMRLEKYVIMPNHIHFLLCNDSTDGRAMLAPTVSRVVQQLKGTVTKKCGMSIWQKSFYDHIIRDEFDYAIKWEYIDENPVKWCDDEFYVN